jgi:hypothetical protein
VTAVLPDVKPVAPAASPLSWAEVLRLPGSRDCTVCGHPSGEAAVCLDCDLPKDHWHVRLEDR